MMAFWRRTRGAMLGCGAYAARNRKVYSMTRIMEWVKLQKELSCMGARLISKELDAEPV